MSVTRKGEYFLLSNDIPLDDELSELDIPVPEPAPLHKRNIQSRSSVSRARNTRRGRVPGWGYRRAAEIEEDGRPSRTYIQMDHMTEGGIVRQFDGLQDGWTFEGLDHYRRSLDKDETVKCVISSVLFLVIVVMVIVVALVKNPEM